MQVWCDQKEVIDQSYQTSTGHREWKITNTVNRNKLKYKKTAFCCYRCVIASIEVD